MTEENTTPLKVLADLITSAGGHICPTASLGWVRKCPPGTVPYKSLCIICIEDWARVEAHNQNIKIIEPKIEPTEK